MPNYQCDELVHLATMKPADLHLGTRYDFYYCVAAVGSYELEIIQPVKETSLGSYPYQWMEQHGEGFHNLAFSYNSEAEYLRMSEILKQHGLKQVFFGDFTVEEGADDESVVSVQFFSDPVSERVIEISCAIRGAWKKG